MATSNRDERYSNDNSVQGGLYDVVIALRSNIMRALNVASLGQVQRVDATKQTASVKLLPLVKGEQDKNVDCYCCMSQKTVDGSIEWGSMADELSQGDIVIVVFLNRNSAQAFSQAKSGIKMTSLLENSDLHSDRYGVIVGVCYKAKKEEKK